MNRMKMDPRGRKKLEKLIRTQGKKDLCLQALNITNLDSLCCFHLCECSPNFYYSFSTLKEKATLLKGIFDILCLDDFSSKYHTSLSSYNQIIRDIPERLAYDTSMNFLPHQHSFKKCSKTFSKKIRNQIEKLMKHMNKKFNFILEENPLNYYITHFVRDCSEKKWRISNDLAIAGPQLKAFLKICHFFPPMFEITSTDPIRLKHYSLFANLLKLCYDLDLQDSEIVMTIFVILLKMHFSSSETAPPDRQPQLPEGILQYILLHAYKMKTNLQSYIVSYCNTIWKFSRNFSVLESLAKGDEKAISQLLKAGFDIFPENEQAETRPKFLYLSETIPKNHKMILLVMEKIESNSLWIENETVTLTEEQKRCFRVICRYFMTSYASKKELYNSISSWYEHVLSNGVNENWCRDRKRRLGRLAKLYADNFPDMAAEVKEPRLLEDLCKISLRNSFRNVGKHTTPAPPIVQCMYRDFMFLEDEDFLQPPEN